MTRYLSILLAILAIAALSACSDSPEDDDPTAAPGETAESADATEAPTEAGSAPGNLTPAIRAIDIPADLADGKSLGSADAPVVLTAFEDFQCPFCLRFTAQDEPVIIEEFVATGQVRLEFRHFPVLRGESILAAIAAECAAHQGRFWEYHEELFVIQAEAGQDVDEKVDQGRFTPEALHGVAETVGLDLPAYEACVQAPETLATVQADEAAAREAGLRGTPNFLVTIAGQTAPLPPNGSDPGGPAEWRGIFEILVGVAETLTPSPTP